MTTYQDDSLVELDSHFLADVGLADLPGADRATFLAHVQESLEERVGVELSNGLSDAQLAEFDALLKRDYERVAQWIDENVPDFLSDQLYLKMVDNAGATAKPADILCEYAATKWLSLNRPDYREVVRAKIAELKSEIRTQAADILGGHGC